MTFDLEAAKNLIKEDKEMIAGIDFNWQFREFLEEAIAEIERLRSNDKKYIEHNYVDATPNGQYALRILQSYRDLCNYSWSDVLNTEPTNTLCIEMNRVNELRKVELDKAIEILRKGLL